MYIVVASYWEAVGGQIRTRAGEEEEDEALAAPTNNETDRRESRKADDQEDDDEEKGEWEIRLGRKFFIWLSHPPGV